MLDRMAHRGGADRAVFEAEGATLGIIRPRGQALLPLATGEAVEDYVGDGHFAEARVIQRELNLFRDPLGVSPLYYGHMPDGTVCFASEVKALLEVARDAAEVPPGHRFAAGYTEPYGERAECLPPFQGSAEVLAVELRHVLAWAVKKRIRSDAAGAWLSGGLDSSTMAALARPHVRLFHTFAAGVAGASDLAYARQVAEHIGARHHEVIVTRDQMLGALPKVIYHLESFDALLVRSSITNYLVARLASDFVPEVFCGEGGDELFAGYHYLKELPHGRLADELLDITNRLHNTALQRVDRCAAAHGLVAHVPFLDPNVVQYAKRIPTRLRLRGGVEKWILRQAMAGMLPEQVLVRPKAKFWEGAGVGEMLAEHADETVCDEDFSRERMLPNGWLVNTKEELMYYRLFREHFGEFDDLLWMGRTKGAPRSLSF
jgi:asparagine synthase (glutamine-hydrolysing)